MWRGPTTCAAPRCELRRCTTVQTLQESQRIGPSAARGITNELDVTLADRELADTQAQLVPLQAQVSAGQYTLGHASKVAPEDLVAELTPPMIPGTPDLAPAGLPLHHGDYDQTSSRRSGELAAASARIAGVATADLFPDVAVTAAIGFQRQGLGTDPAVGQHIWSAGPSVLWPLLDFGTLDAQVDIADLRTRALLVSYRKTIQSAVGEVDMATGAATRRSSSRLSKTGAGRDGEPARHHPGAGALQTVA